MMALPSWEDASLGSKKRVALWLVSVVGEGNLFTYARLRDAFPDTAQIDRRLRDLRPDGWRIDTAREDPSLGMSERRLVSVGDLIWEEGVGQTKVQDKDKPSSTRRREILSRDGNMCRSCGITPGQEYASSFETVQLDIARRSVLRPDGTTAVELITECRRCRVGGPDLEADVAGMLAALARLGTIERNMLLSWVKADQRDFGTVELLWAEYRTLPQESRSRFREALESGRQ
ncbi:hypothetical protein [Kitasatospora herbaricolor]|nr:hypothetical protein [Kitasatospora herbaricolor]